MTLDNLSYNLGQLFSQIAIKFKERVALKYPDHSVLSFRELDVLSNKIGNYLTQSGVRKMDVIFILNNQSNEAYALMIACLKIGAI